MLGVEGIAHAAHIGGLVAGIVLGAVSAGLSRQKRNAAA